MSSTTTVGLRDKKRAETRARLERAAVTLVLRDGVAKVTVDAISEAADVSSRTFFNYFESKEDAILGVHDIELNDELVAEHVARFDGADIVESVIRLLFGIIDPSSATSDLHEMRMKVIKAHPELLSRHISQMTRMADQLTAAIQTLFKADPAFADTAEPSQTAEVLLSLCIGGVRIAIKEWVADGSNTPPEQLESRAIALVREVTKKLQ